MSVTGTVIQNNVGGGIDATGQVSIQQSTIAGNALTGISIHGTLTLARALLASAPQCVLIFASTADAYGSSFRSGLPATEATPLAPMNTV